MKGKLLKFYEVNLIANHFCSNSEVRMVIVIVMVNISFFCGYINHNLDTYIHHY